MEIKLLGTLEAVSGASIPALGGPRARAVLADLALHAGRSVDIARLIDDVWGSSPPVSATHALEVHISRLRNMLDVPGERTVLVKTGSGYLLDVPPAQVDALRFADLAAQGRAALRRNDPSAAERPLASALALWRGPALADVRDAAFAPMAAQRLENDRLTVLESLVGVRLQLGKHLELVSELEAAIAAEPFRERFHAQLMTALYRSGRQADALAAFQRARHLLSELGLEPGRELRELEAAILVQAPGLEATSGQPLLEVDGWSAPVGRPDRPVAGEASGRPAGGPPVTGSRRRLRRAAHPWFWASAVVIVALVIAGLPRVLGATKAPVVAASVGVSELTSAHDRVVRTLSLPSEPAAAVLGDGSVWVTSPEAHALYRIDPATGDLTDTIPVGAGAGAVAVAGLDVWVANTLDGTLSRVDTATDAVVQTVAVGAEPTGIAVGDGSVWVAGASANTLTAVDAVTGTVSSAATLSAAPFGVAYGAGSLWLSDPGDDAITRLDPGGSPGVQIAVGAGPTAVAYGLGSLWVANGQDSTVSRIDPATDAVVATIPVGDGPDGLAIAGNSVWVANRFSSTLTRIDPGTDSPTRTIAIGASPVALTALGGRLWAATQAIAPRLPTGRTLQILSSDPTLSIDPALAYPNMGFQFFEGTYDTLVTYQQVGGSAGLQLVPDLALTMPTITAGGTVYTFTLRPGLRYSDGRTVRPEDFRYAIERVMKLNPSAASFLTSIVGAPACVTGAACDLGRGIGVSDRADSITFHLAAPNPNFLYELAFQFTAPVPSDVADHDVGTDPVPSTGPYMIGRFVPGREVDFIRNPEFEEWSAAAEPAGSPNRIVWTLGEPIPEEVTQIEDGRADWTYDSVPDVATLLTRYPGQVHVNPTMSIVYAAFNTRVAPVNNVKVRQAFSLAANRTALIDLLGGPSAGTPSCQILPPRVPGYQRYCPFTAHPSPSGEWIGPDLAAARKLVAESGTQGMKVTVWTHQYSVPLGDFMLSVLRRLGYRATMVAPPDPVLARNVNDSRRNVQATDGNWFADYPAASDFFSQMRCSSFRLADPAATTDGSFFCDPAADRLMDVANQEQSTDPAQSAATWAAVDRKVTDEAPWVPLVNQTWVDLLSTRIGNYQYNPIFGALLDQLEIHG